MTTLSTGQRFADRYEVRRLLGQGGFGEVYVVRDLRAQPPRELALKVLTETEGLRNVDLVRFRDEIVAINTVAKHSQHVPRVHDTGMDRGRPWFVMDLVQGVTLTEHWQHQHTLGLRPTPAETLTILHDVCDALAAAHAVGLVHCDLKPENIMIKRAPSDPSRWFAYVLDFGIARTAYKHTQRTLAGTPLWMAPEQLTDPDAPSTPAIDQFSFAHVAFWMLVGQKFPLTERQRMRPSQVAAARNVTLPRAFDAWFDRATRDAPTERFPDIALAFNALHAVFAQPPVADPAFAPTLQAPAHIALAPTLAATPPKPPPYAPAKAPQSLPTPRPAATRPVALVVVLVASLASLAVGLTWRSHNATRSHQTLSPTQTPPPAPPPAPPPLPVPTELTPITEPNPRAALARWSAFVESLGDGDARAIYLPQARLRTNGVMTPDRITSWWREWRPPGSTLQIHQASALARQRPFNRALGDGEPCADHGSVYEVRVNTTQVLGDRGTNSRRDNPYDVLTSVYTVRFVLTTDGLRVCHENHRKRDFCPGHELAPDCRNYVSDGTPP